MKSMISHVAIYVKYLEVSREFYTYYFNGLSNDLYQNTKGFSSYFIQFEQGPSLELMHHIELASREVADKVTGYSHIAFSVGSKEAVKSLTNQIVLAGYSLYSSPRSTGDGYFESCVADPDGNRVEITL
ncbi:MAG TPA: VOC family protein [Spirochaetota bacterium]|nr:VOC family protein [Spirochaetota bacterium]